jgi:hypothetical protein
MALNQIDEETKKKLRPLPTMDEAFTDKNFSVSTPLKKIQAPMTPGDPNSEAFYGGSNPQNNQKTIGRVTSLGEPKTPSLYQPSTYQSSTNSNLPKLKEIPNAQRDAELGKMTVSKTGDITTYDIGGNTLSYKGDKEPITLRNINQSGRQQPTWDDYHRQQKARYDAYANAPRGRFFGATPIDTKELVDDSIGGMFVRGLQSRQARADAQIMNAEADRDINRANFLSTLDRNQIARDQLSLDKDKNRIDEQGVIAENKLRDIQGQVLQQPPVKERRLQPMIIEEPDPIDPTGNTKRQRLLMPNADDSGYVDGTPTSSEYPRQLPENHPALKFLRDNPNTKALFKARYKYLPSWAEDK